MKPVLWLASQSERRRDLLNQLRIPFSASPAHIDESVLPGEAPDAYVRRMSEQKAKVTGAIVSEPAFVLGADTIVVLGSHVIGQPRDGDDALRMLRDLSGKRHDVLTAMTLVAAPSQVLECAVSLTSVWFRDMDRETLKSYVATGEWRGKAGGYAIQGLGAGLVHEIHGSYWNVVGLPAAELIEMLKRHGAIQSWP